MALRAPEWNAADERYCPKLAQRLYSESRESKRTRERTHSIEEVPAMKLNEIFPGLIQAQPKDTHSMQSLAHLHRANKHAIEALAHRVRRIAADASDAQAGAVRVEPLAQRMLNKFVQRSRLQLHTPLFEY